MLHEPVAVLLLLFIFFIHMKKYVNCSICAFTLHIATNVPTLCWSKTSPSFSCAHSACIARSINTILYHKSACTSGSICRKRISFISRFGAIVSHFFQRELFLLTLYKSSHLRHHVVLQTNTLGTNIVM